MNALRYPLEAPPAPGDVAEIAEGVLWIRVPLPLRLDHVNAYAFDDGDGWTLVDTGFDTPPTREMWEAVLSGPLAGRPVRRVIGTHHHPDHIGLAGWFVEKHGAELVTTRTAFLFARMLRLEAHDRPPETQLSYWRACGMDAAIYDKRANDRPYNSSDVVHAIPGTFRRIAEGDAIHIGGRDFEVHIGNGHAPEHATLWSSDGSLVIAGDQILSTISPNLGVYATEPEADPVGDWLESCTRLGRYAREGQLALSGHKLPFFGIGPRLAQMISGHVAALDRLEEALATPRRAAECFPFLFRRPIGESEYTLALGEAVAHLNHLTQTGRARRYREPGSEAWLWKRT